MVKELRIAVFTVVLLFISFFLYTKLFGPLPFIIGSTSSSKNPFTVQGTGEVSATPDTALVSLGVNKSAATVEEARKDVNDKINKITADLKKLGVEEKNIKTSNYSVYPDYSFGAGKPTNSFTANATIDVRVKPIYKANQAVDVATQDGATQVGGIQFVLADNDQKKFEDQARIAAIKDAKEKAQNLANAAGIHLGKVINIEENSGNAPRPIMYQTTDLKVGGMGAAEAIPPTQLNPGENKISITVTLSYETY